MKRVRSTRKIILTIVTLMCIHCVKGVDIFGNKIHFNSVIELSTSAYGDAHGFESVVPIQLSGCIKKCERIQACKFINYFWKSHYCVLITTSSPATETTISYPGAVNAMKSEWTLSTFPTECQSCSYYEECVTVLPSNHTCVKKGCPNPTSVQDATQNGNMFRFGSKIKYVCDFSETSVVKVCQEDEHWSNNSFICEVPTTTSTSTTTTTTLAPTTKAVNVEDGSDSSDDSDSDSN